MQTGDQILYVNNVSLKNRPLNEVNQLLRANEEVVKLKVKKDELYAGKNLTKLSFFFNSTLTLIINIVLKFNRRELGR